MKSAAGVLQLPAIASSSQSPPTVAKPSTARLKLVIRRLPPGLTESEFKQALGAEWFIDRGKVDWYYYRKGKISKGLAKPSKPSRAYIHLVDQSYLELLNEKIQKTLFTDSRNTYNDTALQGPPNLEYAPYGRVPASKRRNDVRQGLIDQDSEFIEFLEGLTNPIAKLNSGESISEMTDRQSDGTAVTPLLQHLRDKKAAKEKTTGSKTPKHSRGQSKNDTPIAKHEALRTAQNGRDTADKHSRRATRIARTGKSPRTITKSAKKDAALECVAVKADETVLHPVPGKSLGVIQKATYSPATAAVRMLQRDLGIRENKVNGGRRNTRKKTDAEPLPQSVNTDGNKTTDGDRSENSIATNSVVQSGVSTTEVAADIAMGKSIVKPALVKQKTSSKYRGNGDMASLGEPHPTSLFSKSVPTVSQCGKKSCSQSGTTASSASTTFAFLKHANPSQGITEPLIETALSDFGAIRSVEVDKRKGFAYVEFLDADSLRKAIAASPIAIARGTVQILERKERGSRNVAASNRSNGNANTNNATSLDGKSDSITKNSSRNKGIKGTSNKNARKHTPAVSSNSSKEVTAQPSATL